MCELTCQVDMTLWTKKMILLLTIHNIEQESEKLSQCESIIRARSIQEDFIGCSNKYLFIFLNYISFKIVWSLTFYGNMQSNMMIIKLVSTIVLIQAARCNAQVSWYNRYEYIFGIVTFYWISFYLTKSLTNTFCRI